MPASASPSGGQAVAFSENPFEKGQKNVIFWQFVRFMDRKTLLFVLLLDAVISHGGRCPSNFPSTMPFLESHFRMLSKRKTIVKPFQYYFRS
jgi:hypothetical protein